jgi:hypothetical protein
MVVTFTGNARVILTLSAKQPRDVHVGMVVVVVLVVVVVVVALLITMMSASSDVIAGMPSAWTIAVFARSSGRDAMSSGMIALKVTETLPPPPSDAWMAVAKPLALIDVVSNVLAPPLHTRTSAAGNWSVTTTLVTADTFMFVMVMVKAAVSPGWMTSAPVTVLVIVSGGLVVVVVDEVVDEVVEVVVAPGFFCDGTHSSRRWISSGLAGPN